VPRKPDTRRWVGIRDRAILLIFLDTMVRVSELVGVNAEDVDLKARSMRVMGKGAKQRELPLGQTVPQALRRYQRTLEDVRPEDPLLRQPPRREDQPEVGPRAASPVPKGGRDRGGQVLASHATAHRGQAVHPRRR